MLAAYRKYGSRADGWPVNENHRWRSGALVLATKNGTPMAIASRASTARNGLAPSVGARLSTMAIGVWRAPTATEMANTASADPSTSRWTFPCCRGSYRVLTQWAYR